jgi:hypothetical protein
MADAPPPLPVKRGSCLKVALISFLLIGVATAGFVWWQNRPIQPVVLSAEEKAVVEKKVEAIQKPAEPTYEKGSRDIVLSEREINGLLNDETDLGQKLKIELGTDVILARLETDLDPDLPIVGGKHLKARARAFAKMKDGVPSVVFDDLTVWGVSLPNDWLGHLKGHDVLKDLLGSADGAEIAGVEDIKVEPGQIRIKLKE